MQNPYRHIFDHQIGYPPKHDLSTQSSLIEQKLKQWTLHIKNLANSWHINKWTLTWLCSIQLSIWWHANLSRQKSQSTSVEYELENIIRLKKDYKMAFQVSSLHVDYRLWFSKIYFGVSKSVFSYRPAEGRQALEIGFLLVCSFFHLLVFQLIMFTHVS